MNGIQIGKWMGNYGGTPTLNTNIHKFVPSYSYQNYICIHRWRAVYFFFLYFVHRSVYETLLEWELSFLFDFLVFSSFFVHSQTMMDAACGRARTSCGRSLWFYIIWKFIVQHSVIIKHLHADLHTRTHIAYGRGISWKRDNNLWSWGNGMRSGLRLTAVGHTMANMNHVYRFILKDNFWCENSKWFGRNEQRTVVTATRDEVNFNRI